MSQHRLPLVPVILCGGSGTRLWPLSRANLPKQFLRLRGESSLLQQTLRRSAALSDAPPLLLAQEMTRFIVDDQAKEIGIDHAQIMLEPVQRGTAPAILCAALQMRSQYKEALMLVLPSDHVLEDCDAFIEAVTIARDAASEGYLMGFGIVPDAPETGYGYLQAGAAMGKRTLKIDAFVEKPSRESAEQFILSGQYFWNSGMFLFHCNQLISEMAVHAPDILSACERAVEKLKQDARILHLDANSYAENPNISIDYALMERTDKSAMITLDAGWSDIGSWSSVWESSAQDELGNAIQGDVLSDDCHNCLIQSQGRLVAALGLKDIVIIDTKDALLVMDKQRAQDTRKLVKQLQQKDRNEALAHRQVLRPWGSYDAVVQGQRFQVKLITVKPGGKLSVQMHHHRSEHWIVVSGTARVIDGEKDYLLTENQSTLIDVGIIHSLENPGKIPLELIEVQSGSYLGEDDIVRLHDAYGRA